ncbi:MAG: hypothetical protein BGN94_15115 [Rhizobiales bacterium 68-8]|nr:MAG: hypothetical protein BGN94_15115 [Rhizobiales bacterium 68-8]
MATGISTLLHSASAAVMARREPASGKRTSSVPPAKPIDSRVERISGSSAARGTAISRPAGTAFDGASKVPSGTTMRAVPVAPATIASMRVASVSVHASAAQAIVPPVTGVPGSGSGSVTRAS